MINYDELKKAAEAAPPGPVFYGRIEATTVANWHEPYSPWITGHFPRCVSVGRSTYLHADDAAFIAQANPATILALLSEREKLLKVVDAARNMRDWHNNGRTGFGINLLIDALKELEK